MTADAAGVSERERLARVLDVLEWQIKVATERPSNYDERVIVNATDLRALIAEVRCVPVAPLAADAWDEGAAWRHQASGEVSNGLQRFNVGYPTYDEVKHRAPNPYRTPSENG